MMDRVTNQDLPMPVWAGVRTLFRLPWTTDLTDAQIAFVGIPFDIATTGRPGARFGPTAIRAVSSMIAELAHYPSGFSLQHDVKAVDTGDLEIDVHHPLTVKDAITRRIAAILDAGVFPISMGGDHYVTYPILRAIAAEYGPVSLVHFDAHTDTWEPTSDIDINHGSMFTHAIREGLIDPTRSIQVGIRTHNADTRGIKILDARWVRRHGTAAVVDEILQTIGDTRSYLTFDIDCLDPSFAPGTGTPVSGGLTSGEAIDIVSGIAHANFVGMDLVEVAPIYDSAESTALAGATLIHEFVAAHFGRHPE